MGSREETEETAHLWKLLDIHRKNARLYQVQLNSHTVGFVPPVIISGLRTSLQEIVAIKSRLRQRGVSVVDRDIDSFDLSQFDP